MRITILINIHHVDLALDYVVDVDEYGDAHLLIDALKVAHHLMRHHRVERGDGLVGQYDGGRLPI